MTKEKLDTTAEKWEVTTNRFVAFFDIMGFKDMVQRNSHEEIFDKLENLKNVLDVLEKVSGFKFLEKFGIAEYQTKAITFSDSIVFFSKGDEPKDAAKILIDSYSFLLHSIKKGVPIKGALSYGRISVDFENSLFFGQPIIDAFLLQEELQLYTAIIDHLFESKLSDFNKNESFISLKEKATTNYKANLKTGKVTHLLLKPSINYEIKDHISNVEKLYSSVSGRPRLYVDNTLEFLKSLLPKAE